MNAASRKRRSRRRRKKRWLMRQQIRRFGVEMQKLHQAAGAALEAAERLLVTFEGSGG